MSLNDWSKPVTVPAPLPPAKTGPGCGMGCLAIIGVIIALVIIGSIVGAVSKGGGSSSSGGSSGTSSGGSSSGGTTSGGSSSDPIEQARVVLGGGYSYATVLSATDGALSATGLSGTDDNRSRAWSSVLSVVKGLTAKGYSVGPMDVMLCVPGIANSSGWDFPDSAALCATDLAVNP